MKKIAALTLAILTSVSSFGIAGAHGIWVAERHGDQAIVYGHGASDESYDPVKLTSLVGRTADGSSVDITINRQVDHVLFKAPKETALIMAILDSGYWSKDSNEKLVQQAKG